MRVHVLFLMLVAGCAPGMALDAALPDAGGGDAPGALGADASVDAAPDPVADAPGLDALAVDGGAVDAAVLLEPDASSADAPVASGLCGNGYIDPGEACDPGVFVDGGLVLGGAGCVSSCTVHDCALVGGGVLEPVSHRCIQRVMDDLVDPSAAHWGRRGLVYWESVEERERIFSALRAALEPGGFTGGQISLRRFGGTAGTWYFYRPDGTSIDATDLLPSWTERFPIPDPSSCALLTLRTGSATLGQSPCSSSLPSSLLIFVEPPGIRRGA